MNRQPHWEAVYQTKSAADVSWTQPEPRLSLSLVREVGEPGGRVVDVGGGTSPLVDALLDGGYRVTVLDISAAALERSKARLAERSSQVRWIVADVSDPALDLGVCEIWHDRAVFHFLTEAADRTAYVSLLSRTLTAGGHAIIATFAPDGPERCSGLPVRRYDGAALAAELGPAFTLVRSLPEAHVTPQGKTQSFQYSFFRRAHG